jgi:hypothetical protein
VQLQKGRTYAAPGNQPHLARPTGSDENLSFSKGVFLGEIREVFGEIGGIDPALCVYFGAHQSSVARESCSSAGRSGSLLVFTEVG